MVRRGSNGLNPFAAFGFPMESAMATAFLPDYARDGRCGGVCGRSRFRGIEGNVLHVTLSGGFEKVLEDENSA